MRDTISEFEEWRSNFKEKYTHLRLFVDVVAMQTMYNACVPMLLTREGISQIATVKKLWNEDWGGGDKNVLR